MSSQLVSCCTAFIAATTVACAGQAWRLATGPRATAPVPAALRAFWRYQHAEPPGRLSVNVPPETPLDSGTMRALRSTATAITLFRDTSRYNARNISVDSQRVLGNIYDVRRIPPAVWDSMAAADSNLFAAVEVHGPVYHVSRESCRGWPCHEGVWVEVRRAGSEYQGVVFAWWAE